MKGFGLRWDFLIFSFLILHIVHQHFQCCESGLFCIRIRGKRRSKIKKKWFLKWILVILMIKLKSGSIFFLKRIHNPAGLNESRGRGGRGWPYWRFFALFHGRYKKNPLPRNIWSTRTWILLCAWKVYTDPSSEFLKIQILLFRSLMILHIIGSRRLDPIYMNSK